MTGAPEPHNQAGLTIYGRNDRMVGVIWPDGHESILSPEDAVRLAAEMRDAATEAEFMNIVRAFG